MISYQLKIFQAVATHRGFNRASKHLRLSQPAISVNIKKLEEQLGVELFQRLGRSIQLTDAGRVVLDYVNRLNAVATEMRQAVDGLKGVETGALRCGAATTVGIYLLPKLLVQFKKQFPKVETQLSLDHSRNVEEKVLANELDLGFVNDSFEPASTLDVRDSFTDELVVITLPGHPFAEHQKISPKKIGELSLILGPKNSHTRKIIEKHLERAGITYRCIMEVDNTEVIKAAVSEGLGVSIISLARIQQEIKTGLLVPVRIAGLKIDRQFKLIMLKDKPCSDAMQALLALLP
jgi:DNA-binding transcriptional LysR family regulator